jgi:hypothetical protein
MKQFFHWFKYQVHHGEQLSWANQASSVDRGTDGLLPSLMQPVNEEGGVQVHVPSETQFWHPIINSFGSKHERDRRNQS